MSTQVPEAPKSDSRNWLATLPNDWPAWKSFETEVNRTRAARESLRDHLAKNVSPEKDRRALGLGLFAAGERAAALPHLLACDDPLCRLLAGYALDSAGQHAKATELWNGLLKVPGLGVRARLARMAVLCRRGEVDALQKDVAALREAGAPPAEIAYAEGLLAEASGDHDGAKASWRVALQHDPGHADSRFRLAYRLDLEGNDDDAMALYRSGLDSGAMVHVGTLINLGVLYEDHDQYDAAARCFRAALSADPSNARARRYLADAEASRRQFYDETRERKADLQNAVLRIPVTDFELSVRARNCLQRMNIHTLGDLICRTESELLSFKNFGETSLQEVKDILALKGLRLGMIAPGKSAGQIVEDALAEDEEEEAAAAPAPATPGDVRAKPISELDLSVRSRAALTTLGINTVGELAATSEDTLLACKNFGQTSLVEIKTKLEELGLSLAST
jgi:DNA-directed RNA polymerase subunit alpha